MRLSKVSFAFDTDVFAIITYFRKNYTFSKKWGNATLGTSTGNIAKNLEMIGIFLLQIWLDLALLEYNIFTNGKYVIIVYCVVRIWQIFCI